MFLVVYLEEEIKSNLIFPLLPKKDTSLFVAGLFVVYFDQLSGAACTQKLVKTFFSAVFKLFCSFQTFFSE